MKTTITAAVADAQTGISIRFIRQWNPVLLQEWTPIDRAFALAEIDDRDLPFMEKFAQALEFMRRQVH